MAIIAALVRAGVTKSTRIYYLLKRRGTIEVKGTTRRRDTKQEGSYILETECSPHIRNNPLGWCLVPARSILTKLASGKSICRYRCYKN